MLTIVGAIEVISALLLIVLILMHSPKGDGIEFFYPYPRFRKIVKFHSAKDVRKIADKYPQLLKTGGTDFHGANQQNISYSLVSVSGTHATDFAKLEESLKNA